MTSFLRINSTFHLTFLNNTRSVSNLLQDRNINRMARIGHHSRLFELRLKGRRPRQLTNTLNLRIPRNQGRNTSNRILSTLLETRPTRLQVTRRRVPYRARIIRRFLSIAASGNLKRKISNPSSSVITATSNRSRSITKVADVHNSSGVNKKVVQVKIRNIKTEGNNQYQRSRVVHNSFNGGTRSTLPSLRGNWFRGKEATVQPPSLTIANGHVSIDINNSLRTIILYMNLRLLLDLNRDTSRVAILVRLQRSSVIRRSLRLKRRQRVLPVNISLIR